MANQPNSKFGFFQGSNSITVYSASTQNTSFDKSNIINYLFPLRPHKFTGTAANSTIRFSVPTSVNVKGLLIRDCNCNTLVVRTSATSVTFSGGGDVDVVLAPKKDTRTARYGVITSKATTAGAEGTMNSNDPYWQILFQGAANVNDGASAYRLASIYVITDLWQLNYGFQFPFNIRRSKGTIRADRPDLSSRVIDFNKPKVVISLPANLPARANGDFTPGGEDRVYSLAEQSLDTGLVFWENRERDNGEILSRAYHVRMAQDIQVDYTSSDIIIDTTLELEEIT